MNDNKLYINDSLCCEESYIRCAGLDVGDYTLKIDPSCIMDFPSMIREQINEELLKQVNRVYIPEVEEDEKYVPNYRLGFL